MIVVGAVDNDGKTWENSQGGDLQDLAAPGVEVVCADGESNKPQVQDGTSFCKWAHFRKYGFIVRKLTVNISNRIRLRTRSILPLASRPQRRTPGRREDG